MKRCPRVSPHADNAGNLSEPRRQMKGEEKQAQEYQPIGEILVVGKEQCVMRFED